MTLISVSVPTDLVTAPQKIAPSKLTKHHWPTLSGGLILPWEGMIMVTYKSFSYKYVIFRNKLKKLYSLQETFFSLKYEHILYLIMVSNNLDTNAWKYDLKLSFHFFFDSTNLPQLWENDPARIWAHLYVSVICKMLHKI